MSQPMRGTLYVVPTPIGNLEDITLRALRVLKEAHFIAAEDTRHTKKLLNHFDIHPTELFSYREQNSREAGAKVRALLEQGRSGAVVSDAGMPAISDPGRQMIADLVELGSPFVVLPGPSALLTALVGSGLATGAFSFHGFLDRRAKVRRSALEFLKMRPETLVFFESPHRIEKSLADMHAVFGDRQVVVARELTKVHEHYARGRLSEWSALLPPEAMRGEMVVLIEGMTAAPECPETADAGLLEGESAAQHVRRLMDEGLDRKEAMRAVAKARRITRRAVYQSLLLQGRDLQE
ncbi:MAG: 16S rRNA (cytidine(1402)-2'-O)-methyltransferase [Bacilli bacterium]